MTGWCPSPKFESATLLKRVNVFVASQRAKEVFNYCRPSMTVISWWNTTPLWFSVASEGCHGTERREYSMRIYLLSTFSESIVQDRGGRFPVKQFRRLSKVALRSGYAAAELGVGLKYA